MLYSQLRIEDVQVAQIVCVVCRAEPGQHQQQQSLHGQCSALFPLFSPSFSPLCTEALSSSILPASPSCSTTSNTSNALNLDVVTPHPPPPVLTCLPSPEALSDQNCSSAPTLFSPFLFPLCFFPLPLPLCLCELARFFLCLRLAAWSSQLQRQTGQLPEVEDGAEEEEEAAAEQKSCCGRRRRGESAGRGRRPMQRWHIWNTI